MKYERLQHLFHTACSDASFYYNGNGLSVNHHCSAQSSCKGAVVSGLPINKMDVACNGTQSCDKMDIYTPINTNEKSNINITALTTSTHIYSLHGLTNLNINCAGDCTNDNDANIIYGAFYEGICDVFDRSCMESAEVNNVAFQVDDNVNIQYNLDGDYANLLLNENRVL